MEELALEVRRVVTCPYLPSLKVQDRFFCQEATSKCQILTSVNSLFITLFGLTKGSY